MLLFASKPRRYTRAPLWSTNFGPDVVTQGATSVVSTVPGSSRDASGAGATSAFETPAEMSVSTAAVDAASRMTFGIRIVLLRAGAPAPSVGLIVFAARLM